MKKIILYATLLTICFACTLEDIEKSAPSVTGEVSNLTPNSATLGGKANLSNITSDDIFMGILYSTSEGVLKNNANEVIANDFDANFNYTVNINGLTPSTTYYYRSFISQASEISYGDTKSFTTPDVEADISVNEASDVKNQSARITGTINIVSTGNLSCSASLYYSNHVSDKESLIQYGEYQKLSVTTQRKFECQLNNLSTNTSYNYIVVAQIEGQTFYSNIGNFSTKPFSGNISSVSAGQIDLKTATISGKFTQESDEWISCSGVVYYGTEPFDNENYTSFNLSSKSFQIYSGGSFSVSISNLRPATQYYYLVKVNADNYTFKSDVNTFTTKDLDYTFSVRMYASSPTAAKLTGDYTMHSSGTWNSTISIYMSDTASDINSLKNNNYLYKQGKVTLGTSYSSYITPIKPSTTYYYLVEVSIEGAYSFDTGVKSFTTSTPKAVDLGLPSGTLWASTDLGDGNGADYFAWGEIYAYAEDHPDNQRNYDYNKKNNSYNSNYYRKTYYTSDTYLFGKTTQTSGSQLTKYNPTDKLTTLEPCDDAAHVRWGSNWYTPTEAEWNELIRYCTWTHSSGVYTATGPNGNSITLTSPGRTAGSGGVYNNIFCYWTSTQATSYVEAKCIGDESWTGDCIIETSSKAIGLPIRPVYRP